MRATLKKGWTWFGLGLLALAGAAIVAGHLMVDPARLTALAQQHVQATLGRKLDIEGLQLRLLPVPMLRATRIALSNPPWAQGEELASADQFEARLTLLALLRGRIELHALSAQTLALDLEVDRQGRRNWDFGSAPPSIDLETLPSLSIAQLKLVNRQPGQAPAITTVQQLRVAEGPAWRKSGLSGQLSRNGQDLRFSGRLDALPRLDTPAATAEGEVTLEGEHFRLQAKGRLPFNAALEGYDLALALKAESLAELQRFTGWDGPVPKVPLELAARLQRHGREHRFSDTRLTLGQQAATAEGAINFSAARPGLRASVSAALLDWPQALLDLGLPPPAAHGPGLLPARRLPWAAIDAMRTVDARIETRIERLRVRGGLELQDWRSSVLTGTAGLQLKDTRFRLLGGSASGNLALDPHRKQMDLDLAARNVSLQAWFRRRPDSSGIVSNGQMQLAARVTGRGESWKEIGASLDGPLTLAIGPMQVHSKKAHEAEALLVDLMPALAARNAQAVQLACINASLPFVRGIASSKTLAGMRSDVSKLLLAGQVDLRSDTLEMGGRVHALSGATLGIATLAGEVRIEGPLTQPKASLDSPGTLARIGAALATTGLSILATAAYDAATSDDDPCATVAAAARNTATAATPQARAGKPKPRGR
ncbi:MAG: hypothetical protein JWP36_236 [Paucimonas sp.]|nr:hypothetical protein [Paucimonas sp.]